MLALKTTNKKNDLILEKIFAGIELPSISSQNIEYLNTFHLDRLAKINIFPKVVFPRGYGFVFLKNETNSWLDLLEVKQILDYHKENDGKIKSFYESLKKELNLEIHSYIKKKLSISILTYWDKNKHNGNRSQIKP